MVKCLSNNSIEVIDQGDTLPEIEEKKVVKKPHTKREKRDGKFLLSAKNLYLTYSNCALVLEKVLEQLKEILCFYIVEEYLLVREYHETGEPHIHVYLKTRKKCNISSPTFLDLKESSLKNYHGNYQSAKKVRYVIEYILKRVPNKTDSNLIYSRNMSKLIRDLAEYKTVDEVLITLDEEGKIEKAIMEKIKSL